MNWQILLPTTFPSIYFLSMWYFAFACPNTLSLIFPQFWGWSCCSPPVPMCSKLHLDVAGQGKSPGQAGCAMDLVSFSRSSSLNSWLPGVYIITETHSHSPSSRISKHRPHMCIFCVHIQLWVWLSPTISIHVQEKSFLPITALWNQFHLSAFCCSLQNFTISSLLLCLTSLM